MKKLFCFLIATALLLCASLALADDWKCPACGNDATGNFCSNCGAAKPEEAEAAEEPSVSEEPEIPEEPTEPTEPEQPESGEGYSVLKEYSWSSMWGNYYAMVLKNTSGITCKYDIQLVFYDSSNNIVGVSNPSVTVCDDGYEILVQASCDTIFDHVEYNVEQESSSYNDVHSYVTVTAEKADKKAILKGVNTGTVDAEFVEYHCLFLNDNDEVVGTGWGYLVDSSSALKSGKTELREESCSEDFTKVAVYFEGRTDNSIVNDGTVDAEDITVSTLEGCEIIKEYSWNSSWYNNYALEIKNTSGETNGYRGRIIFYDAENNIVGVSNPEITVLDDGYETLMSASQDNAFDHIAYSVQPQKTSYEDVHSFVEVTANATGKKAILVGKNNGTQAAKFVEYHCLFLDKDGSVVGSDWGYLVDDDSELKPGKTEMREADCYADYDSAIVFFEGRY